MPLGSCWRSVGTTSVVDRLERIFERERGRRIHRQRDGAAMIEAADLRRAEHGFELHHVAQRHDAAARRHHRDLRQLFRRIAAGRAQDDRHALLAVEIFAEPGAVGHASARCYRALHGPSRLRRCGGRSVARAVPVARRRSAGTPARSRREISFREADGRLRRLCIIVYCLHPADGSRPSAPIRRSRRTDCLPRRTRACRGNRRRPDRG